MAEKSQPGVSLSVVRKDPAAREIIARWRRLTTPDDQPRAGRGLPILVACSGGADSTALVLALASARAPMVVAHVVHDLRSRCESLADRDAVIELGRRLAVPVVTLGVRPRSVGGNAEATARRLRYAALARAARARTIAFVATAHHAHDQLETALMRLARGSGVRGLAGIAPKRPLARGVVLIRPMLGVEPADARRLCSLARVAWREDVTNADTKRTRAAIRAHVLPALLAIAPRAARKATDAARWHLEATRFIDSAARGLDPSAATWPRAMLRPVAPAVLAALWRQAVLARGAKLDKLSGTAIEGLTRRVKSDGTDPGRFQLGGITFRVTARSVTADAPAARPGHPGNRA